MRRVMIICCLLLGAWSLSAQTDTLKQQQLEKVVVTGTRHETDMRHLPMTVTTISDQQLRGSHRLSLLPLLNDWVPGLFTTSRGMLGYGVSRGAAGMFSMRGVGGSHPNAGMLVLVDGVPQYAGLLGHSIADACQTMLAERVEVLRGPASMLYGSNAMGGVINIVTRKLDQDDEGYAHANVSMGSYGTLQTELSCSIFEGKFFGIVGVNHGRTDGHRPRSAFKQETDFFKLGYHFSSCWKLVLDWTDVYFKASNPGEVTNPYIDNDQKVKRAMASLNLTHRHENSSGALRAYYHWGEHKVNDGYHPGEEPQTSLYRHDDFMAGVSVYESCSFFPGNRLTVGADWIRLGGEAWNQRVADGEREEIADRAENEWAAYMEMRQELAGWIYLHAGIRVDHHTRVGTEWIPQGGIAVNLSNDIELKASVGEGFRNPTIREMYMFPSQNADLKPERLMNYELGYKQSLLSDRLRWGVNVFYIRGKDLISTVQVEGKPRNMNVGEVENHGVEVAWDYSPWSKWNFHANYSYLHMEYPVVAAPEHKVFVSTNYAGRHLSFTTSLQYIGGLYTSVDVVPEKEYFLLWNMQLDYRFRTRYTLFARGENLLAQRYEINRGFPLPKATFTGGFALNF